MTSLEGLEDEESKLGRAKHSSGGVYLLFSSRATAYRNTDETDWYFARLEWIRNFECSPDSRRSDQCLTANEKGWHGHDHAKKGGRRGDVRH